MRMYVPVDVHNMPDVFDITVGGSKYLFRVDYNEVADFYAATIIKDDRVLLSGEPMLLGNIIGIDIPDRDLPLDDIKIMDEAGQLHDAGFINFMDGIKPYIDEVDPNGSETDNPDVKPLGYDPDDEDDETDAEGTIVI